MQFNSYVFIMLFLPLSVILYFAGNRISGKFGGKIVLLAAGALFYAYAGLHAFLILGASMLFNLLAACLIRRFHGKWILIIGIIGNIALLVFYKYLGFLLNNLNVFLPNPISVPEIFLPLGISFFTFQQIAYLVSLYRGELTYTGLFDYLIYILYFPKLIMGPITDPEKLISQFHDDARKTVNWENIASGAKLFCCGMFKKMILADTFAKAVAWGNSNLKTITSMEMIIVTLAYTFEIYFDFSGYSDMSIGVSKMLNIDLPMNFDSPYKALSIRDFWKRWHMSLTSFFTKYVYFPLGGSRKGKARTYLNVIIIFLISGLWHGANWTFILWGFLHGAFCVADRIFEKQENKLSEPVRWFATFSVVNLLWLLFQSESVGQWLRSLKTIFYFQKTTVSNGLLKTFILPEVKLFWEHFDILGLNGRIRGLSMLLFMVAAFVICLVPENSYRKMGKTTIVSAVALAAAFVWSFLCLGSESVFVYFGF